MVCVNVNRKASLSAGCCAALDVEDLSKIFDTGRFQSLTLRLGAGEIMGVFGDPATGKSTLIDLLTGHTMPDSGRIILDGEEITALSPEARAQRGIAFAPPADWLHPDLTAFENVVLQSDLYNRPFFPRQGAKDESEETRAALEFVGLTHCADQRVETLSAMQRRLLTVAIGLAQRPKVLLLSDPWDGWAAARMALSNQLTRIARSGISVFFTALSSHPVTGICHRVAVLRPEDADGGPPMGLARSANVQRYIRYVQ